MQSPEQVILNVLWMRGYRLFRGSQDEYGSFHLTFISTAGFHGGRGETLLDALNDALAKVDGPNGPPNKED